MKKIRFCKPNPTFDVELASAATACFGFGVVLIALSLHSFVILPSGINIVVGTLMSFFSYLMFFFGFILYDIDI